MSLLLEMGTSRLRSCVNNFQILVTENNKSFFLYHARATTLVSRGSSSKVSPGHALKEAFIILAVPSGTCGHSSCHHKE